MSNLDKAIKILKENGLTCVLVKDECVYTSSAKGVAPVLDLITTNTDLKGFALADKIIGKSVAFLAIKAGVSEVYSEIISDKAIEIFAQAKIPVTYGLRVERILNQNLTGFCPMESLVFDVEDVDHAYQLLHDKLAEFRQKAKAINLNPQGAH